MDVLDKIKAVKMFMQIRDSDSGTVDTFAAIGGAGLGADTDKAGLAVRVSWLTNDKIRTGQSWVPCNASGNVYISIEASGGNTLDIWLSILGYVLGE